MDLKALIAKMDEIESKQVLTESEDKDRKPAKKQEREVELPSGAKVKATKVQGWQSQKADKEADKERKKHDESISFSSTIAKTLMREFGYDEQISEAGEWAPTPEQEKWLGGANRQDPYILNRMPGDKPPVSYFKDPKDQELAKRMKFPDDSAGGAATKPAAAAAPVGTQAQTDDEGNTMITKPDGSVQVVGPDGNVIPPGGGKATPASATAQPPAGGDAAVAKTRERMKALLAKLGKTGGAA